MFGFCGTAAKSEIGNSPLANRILLNGFIFSFGGMDFGRGRFPRWYLR
jgi:hypothetical protein